jgi:hypothetical protein
LPAACDCSAHRGQTKGARRRPRSITVTLLLRRDERERCDELTRRATTLTRWPPLFMQRRQLVYEPAIKREQTIIAAALFGARRTAKNTVLRCFDGTLYLHGSYPSCVSPRGVNAPPGAFSVARDLHEATYARKRGVQILDALYEWPARTPPLSGALLVVAQLSRTPRLAGLT